MAVVLATHVLLQTSAASVTSTSPNADDDGFDLTSFKHFMAHNKTQTCSTDDHNRPFNNQIRGVNLGTFSFPTSYVQDSV